jgi:hypothetical protein
MQIVAKPMPAGVIVCDGGREVREDWATRQGNSRTKTSSDTIQKASNQITIATHSLLFSTDRGLKSAKAARVVPNWDTHVIVPVVVTTANLSVIRFNPQAVDRFYGTIAAKDAQMIEVDSLIYQHPLSSELSLHPGTDEGRARAVLELPNKPTIIRQIYIVRSSYFEKFLSDLAREYP